MVKMSQNGGMQGGERRKLGSGHAEEDVGGNGLVWVSGDFGRNNWNSKNISTYERRRGEIWIQGAKFSCPLHVIKK
jgi:hypothetical protein